MATYIVSDLHGRLDLYQEIEKFRASGDKIICLGDCGDRGYASFETLKAVADNPDWKCLLGNHEHMTCCALREVYYKENFKHFYPDGAKHTSFYNGGEDAFLGIVEEGYQPWISYLSRLDFHITLSNDTGITLDLTHSGYDIMEENLDPFDCIWNRSHFMYPWPTEKKYNNIIMVHGHTPIPYLCFKWKPEDGPTWYRDGHKINIDAGSVWTGATILLNADTLEHTVLYGSEGPATDEG